MFVWLTVPGVSNDYETTGRLWWWDRWTVVLINYSSKTKMINRVVSAGQHVGTETCREREREGDKKPVRKTQLMT